MSIHIGPWDILLIVIVSLQATLLAYLRQPKLKALILSLPLPFTISALALNRPVDATNVLGLIVLFGYTQGVRLLYVHARLPILWAILLAAGGDCAIGWLLKPIVPTTDLAFWLAAVGTIALGMLLYRWLPERPEPGQRTELPVHIKLPIIASVILFVVLVKGYLGGFMTAFPMVGLVASYEARRSLWTVGRQITVCMVTATPLLMVCRLGQGRIGLGPSLALGWVVFLSLLLPLSRSALRRTSPAPYPQSNPIIPNK